MTFEVFGTLDSCIFSKGTSYTITVVKHDEETDPLDKIPLQLVSFPMALSRALFCQDPNCLCSVIGSVEDTICLSIMKTHIKHEIILKRAIEDINASTFLNYDIIYEEVPYMKDPVTARAAIEQYFERKIEFMGWSFIHEFGHKILFRTLDLGGFSILDPTLSVHICISDENKSPAFTKFSKASKNKTIWMKETTIKFSGKKSFFSANLFTTNPKPRRFEPTGVVAIPRMGHIAAHRVVSKRTGLKDYWRLVHGIFIGECGFSVVCTLDGCEDCTELLYPSECLLSGHLVERNYLRMKSSEEFFESLEEVIMKIFKLK